ncbi:MAG: Carboxy-terminal processing protease [Microgenomates group bacterium GW2011_GWA2_40_6]|nr:MAG: Carboxy-terminal processing protease [Microgenomates group bacterium GW2011_GWA2_40_6]
MKEIGRIFLVILIVTGLGCGVILVKDRIDKKANSQDKYMTFSLEIYDQIKTNYWEKISDDELSNIFLLAVNKLTGKTDSLVSQDKKWVKTLIKGLKIEEGNKKEFFATMGDLVLANLQPFGRSRLYAQKDEKALSNAVNNVEPGTDRFATLGVDKNADDQKVAEAFVEKSKEATTTAQKAEVKKAYEVLKDEPARKVYAVSGVEPTIEYKLLNPQIFYVHLTKFSPTTLEEFARVTQKVDEGETLDTLIFDLRGNIGGAVDGLPYFLGPFIGMDTYAYQFYHQGEKEDFKTKIGWMKSLLRYNKVIILIDENSQSTAEVMAATLKKYNVGVVLGTTTKGWGTVEKVYSLKNQIADDETYSIFLVNRVTLREDGQPIEGRGVDPQISIKDPDWKKELLKKYNFPGIVRAVEEIYKGL